MAAVNSTMQVLGTSAPDFSLPNTNDEMTLFSRSTLVGKPLMVMFICNHCPFVIHVMERLTELANSAHKAGVGVVAISSNDIQKYPQDGPEAMRNFAKEYGIEFAYLFDEDQSIAKAYGASCTPDFFIYDQQHRLQYRGQMDASRPGNTIAVSGNDLHVALEAVVNGTKPNAEQHPSIGCNIKWKVGNEPDYF